MSFSPQCTLYKAIDKISAELVLDKLAEKRQKKYS